jgi:RimJ/RimL family protein N-acetyltransferase
MPLDYELCTQYFDNKYDGVSNLLLGVMGGSGNINGVLIAECDEKNRRAKVHYAYDECGRGKLLLESVSKFFDYMFNERGFISLYAEISAKNEKSLQCTYKLGFKKICTLPNYFNEEGTMQDAELLVLEKENRKV